MPSKYKLSGKSSKTKTTKFAVMIPWSNDYIEGLDYDSSTKTKLVQAFNKELHVFKVH